MWGENKTTLKEDKIEFAHLLIVDDDPRICRLLKSYLESEAYRVSIAADGTAMWKYVESSDRPDLIVLDVMLPGVDGITLARELRVKTDIGIIMLTARDDPVDTIVGLEVGADDYVTKPFDNKQLLARIRSLLRRLLVKADANGNHLAGSIVQFEGWNLDLSAYELVSPIGEKIRLTTQEFRLLEIFVNNAGQVLSRNKIMQCLSQQEWLPDNRSLDVMIGRLRKRIEENTAEPKIIRTIRNVGYQFTAIISMA